MASHGGSGVRFQFPRRLTLSIFARAHPLPPAVTWSLERFRANPGKALRALWGLAAPGVEPGPCLFLPKPVTHQVTNTLWGKATQTFMEGMENVSQSVHK